MELRPSFEFASAAGPVPAAAPVGGLGALAGLIGTWKGHGFNQIWRPNFDKTGGPQDRFLELNETDETLEFEEVPGEIPNRGLLQDDINLFGVRYLQQVQDTNVLGKNGHPTGIHVEPGFWINIPKTKDPSEPATVARLATIPHGTSLVAQGTVLPTIKKAPPFAKEDITPFVIGSPTNLIKFPESNLATPSKFRTVAKDIPHVTQAMVDDPNTFLAQSPHLKKIASTTTLKISTLPLNPPATGGGTSNIAFLDGGPAGPGARPNAVAAQMDAIFWIETFKDSAGRTMHQLQYTQRVLLNFNGLSWPHISVATLIKQ